MRNTGLREDHLFPTFCDRGNVVQRGFCNWLRIQYRFILFWGHNSYALCFPRINTRDLKSMLFVKTVMYMWFFFFYFILRFFYSREIHRKRQRHRQTEKQASFGEPDPGSRDHTLRRRQMLSHWALQVPLHKTFDHRTLLFSILGFPHDWTLQCTLFSAHDLTYTYMLTLTNFYLFISLTSPSSRTDI